MVHFLALLFFFVPLNYGEQREVAGTVVHVDNNNERTYRRYIGRCGYYDQFLRGKQILFARLPNVPKLIPHPILLH